MDTTKITGNGLLTFIIILYTLWFMGIAFFDVGPLFHITGALATLLFVVRIVRGDD
jgi:hypothetical protein